MKKSCLIAVIATLAALAVLGYPRATAMSALAGVKAEGMGTDELVRAALKRLF